MNRSQSLSSSSSACASVTPGSSWFSNLVRSRSAKTLSPGPSRNSNSADSFAPIAMKNRFRGVLFRYGPKPIQVAFRTGDYKQQVIFIGGLGDGFMATEYLVPLATALDNEKWSLVQILLSSSYSAYGTSSLEQDAMEIDQLISYLINKEDSDGVVLLGHSTGCQDLVHYMCANAACSRAVRAAILQAPVSDREYRATLPETADLIDLAAKMIGEGNGSGRMPRDTNPDAPVTAYRIKVRVVNYIHPLTIIHSTLLGFGSENPTDRPPDFMYHSLCAYMGDDDMFSSDLTDDQLRIRLGHMSSIPCQVIFSMADEYVPEYVDKKALVARLCRALGGAEKVEIEYGNHSLSNRVGEAVHAIVCFIRREGMSDFDDPWK